MNSAGDAGRHRQFTDAGRDGAARHEGRDGSGTVHVTVGGDGRVVDLRLDRSWRTTVGPHGLPAAVLAATGDAASTAASDRLGGRAHTADARRTELLSMLEGVQADLVRRIDRQVRQQVVGRSPTHVVSVTVAGDGRVVDVDVQHRFLDQTDDQGIAHEVLGAFRSAYDRAGTVDIGSLLGDGALSRLQALGGDPAELLRRLGLPTR